MSIAKWHGFNREGPVTNNPVKAGPKAGAPSGKQQQEGRLLVHRREEAGHLVHPEGDGRTGDPTHLLHLRRSIPGCRADQVLPGRLAARPSQLASHAPPGAPSFPRRPGRRRARAPAAPAARGAAGCCRSARSRRRRVAAVPFRARLPIPRELTGAEIEIPIREAEAQILPGPQDEALDLRRHLPGADGPPPRRRADRGHLPPRAAGRGRRAHGPPPRRPQPHPVRRPAGGPDQVAAALLLLPHPARALRPASRATTCCSRPGGGKPTSTT